ncbi:MAG: Eco57I restriction-modification methylase domain-containing protein, partial [Thermodesulfobacteriota bacterium]|nr:Eco57I restriction-modification methylase domain-containing protein [Thermodesulfobacteriota bacterium]
RADDSFPDWFFAAQALWERDLANREIASKEGNTSGEAPYLPIPYSLLAEQALLSLRLCDPACGSGHFLISAAHRIGKHLAVIRTGESEPPPEKRRQALRDVVSHCIYGVDLNPLAVELCKVALWIETLDPGRPLGFLDHRIKCGNSLIGATPELLANGIPDDAFKPKEGDDPVVASSIRRKNREERRGQQNLFMIAEDKSNLQEVASAFSAWAALPEDTAQQVTEKAKKFESLQSDYENRHQRQLADLWTAAFFWPLGKQTYDSVPTQDIFRRCRERSYEIPPKISVQMEDIFFKHLFFHWFLEFPEVFASPNPSPSMGEGWGGGGFDVVLGNPPWERIKLQEKEFFAQRNPEIANAPNAAARKRLIAQLQETNPGLWSQFLEAKRSAECESHFLRASERYPLSAVGDINTYQIFAGLARQLVSKNGRVGIIVPSGVATDDTNKQFFADLTEKKALGSLYDFENREGIFPGVHRSYKFCLLTMGGANSAPKGADFAFFLKNTGQLREEDRHFSLSAEDIALLNPNTRTCPIFRSKRDAEITKDIYRRVPILIDESKGEAGNPWGISFLRMFDMTNDSHLFRTREQLEVDGWRLEGNVFRKDGEEYLPLYEAKMCQPFNHRAADVVVSAKAIQRKAQPDSLSVEELQNPDRVA